MSTGQTMIERAFEVAPSGRRAIDSFAFQSRKSAQEAGGVGISIPPMLRKARFDYPRAGLSSFCTQWAACYRNCSLRLASRMLLDLSASDMARRSARRFLRLLNSTKAYLRTVVSHPTVEG